jgi:fucose permease
MTNIILLIVIYIAFISLGLPDSILGTAWPTMRLTFQLPLETAGLLIMISTLSTAFSSLVSGHVIRRFGTGRVTFISCVLTGSMLLGYSFAPAWAWLFVLTIPLGLGAGAVDTGLNNYVAKHFAASHMSWLHCFWGIGASLGPVIMTYAITQVHNWRIGYRAIGFIQLILSVILLLSLPIWRTKEDLPENPEPAKREHLNVLRIKGAWLGIIAFLLYMGVEAGTGVWLGTLLIEGRGIPEITAGIWISLFYAAITAGRFLCGFITRRFTNRQMIRGGLITAIIGAGMLLFPFKALILPGIILIGLGCAPVFPCMVHETPKRFGNSQSGIIIGYQMGMAYLSGVLIIPLIGLCAGRISLETIPLCIFSFSILTLIDTERLNQMT